MKAVKVGDIGTEHDGFHPTKVIAGSSDVFIDGKPAARVGDPLEPHDKPNHSKHARAIESGSSTVFINGKPAALTGGAISCGGVTIGSGTVNIGDVSPPAMTNNVSTAGNVSSVLHELPIENMVAMNGEGAALAELKTWGKEEEKGLYEEAKELFQEFENEINRMVEFTEYKKYPVSEVRVNNTLNTFEVYGDGELQASYPVESGRTGVTDFMLKGKGPTPPGVYYVDPEEVSEVHFVSYAKRNFFDRADWGHVRAPLHPAQSTETFGRDKFFVHGGSFPGSAGCLDIGENDIEFLRNVKESKHIIKIVIEQ